MDSLTSRLNNPKKEKKMRKTYYSVLTALVLTASGCLPGTQVPDEIVEAVSIIAVSNGFQPRKPHYMLEQFVPAVTTDKKQRSQLASVLLDAITSDQTTPAGRTVLAQHLAKIADNSDLRKLKRMLGNPQTEADIRIALGETAASQIKRESLKVYEAEIKSNDPAKQISGLSGISRYYPKAAPQHCLNMINSENHAVYATAIRLLAELDANVLMMELSRLNKENQLKVMRVIEEQKLTDIVPIAEPVIRFNKGGEKKVLLVTGLEYPGHPWRETAPMLAGFLAQDKRLEVSYIEDPRILAQSVLNSYDVIVLNYQNHQVPAPDGALANLKRVVEDGKGLVLMHFACGAFIDWETKVVNTEFAEIAGRVWNPNLRGHDPRGLFRVQITDTDHPITKGLTDFDTDDELYTCLDGTLPIQVLATAKSKVDQKDYPMAFVLTPGKGRTFHCVLGHDLKALNDTVGELYRHGTLWTARLE